MGKIRLLPDELVNQIAAGEVVERPASVVKELVDNAMDAGATRVVVEIKDGGKELIRVRDNGSGMSKEDLEMAVVRHATSKIYSLEELMRVRTHGFRGEALASVGAVSKLRLRSSAKQKSEDELFGWELMVEGGKQVDARKVGMTEGTEVEVEDLFFNVPGRLKFLKSSSTEAKHVLRIISEQALAHPEVEVNYSHNDREILSLSSGLNLQERIQKVIGGSVVGKMVEVYYDHPHLRVKGWVGKPETGHTRRAEQYLMVNGRPVQDRTVAAAVKEAMGRLMMPKMQVPWVLYVEMPSEMVDVNVHPRKEEVRFVNSSAVFRAVKEAVEAGMDREDLRVGAGATRSEKQGMGAELVERSQTSGIRSQENEVENGKLGASSKGWGQGMGFNKNLSTNFVGDRLINASRYGRSGMVKDKGDYEYRPIAKIDSLIGLDQFSDNEIVQLNKLYLVTEEEDGMVVVDQHAADERVKFEQLMKEFHEKRSQRQSQPLLVEEEIDLSASEVEVVREQGEVLERLGFEWEWRDGEGKAVLAVKSVPLVLTSGRKGAVQIGRLLREVIDDLMVEREDESHNGSIALQDDGASNRMDSQSERIITFMACRSAVKAGDYLTPLERKKLIQELRSCEMPYTCPHGRPVEIKLQWGALERMFKRQV